MLIASRGHDPAWSPDGSKLSYVVDGANANNEIWVADPDGSHATRLTIGQYYRSPAWSPDGQRVSYLGTPDHNCHHMFAAGVPDVLLYCSGAIPRDLHWSPRFDKLAFGAAAGGAAGGTPGLYVVNPDGSGLQVIIDSSFGFLADHPSWSPSGDWIAYSYDGSGETVRTTPDGVVRTPPIAGREPDYSPDGTKLVLVDSAGALDVVNDAGGDRVTITDSSCPNSSCDASQPEWQPLPPAPVPPGYPRPRGAGPTDVPLVPAFEPCESPNDAHGAPLAFGSCSPPVQTSGSLTVGTPDANGQGARSIGRASLRPIAGDPATPGDQADVRLTVSVTDVRCRAGGSPGCDAPLADYTGSLREQFDITITDKYNGGLATESATGTILPSYQSPATMIVPCAPSADVTVGATCSLDTTAEAIAPNIVREGKRNTWALGRVELWDAGADGNVFSDDNTLFAVQGLFVP
jgi:hypothetical protein